MPVIFRWCAQLLILAVGSNCLGAPAVIRVTLPTNDIVFDPVSDQILASVPSSAGAQRGNTITPINPHTGALGTSVFVASEPTILALADDGSRVYVASDSTNLVTPFSLLTMTPGSPFPLEAFDRRVDDMEVAPGNPAALAVSMRRVGTSPRGAGMVVYVNGTRLPMHTTDSAINNVIEFGDTASILYGHANELSDADFNAFAIDLSPSGGVGNDYYHAKHLITGTGSDMEFENGRMYFTNGQIVAVNGPSPLGSFAANGPVEPDSSTGRTFFVVGNKLKAFSQSTFVPLGEMTIPQFTGSARDLISLGDGALATATSSGHILIIRGIPGDYDGNGTVGASDYGVWKANFGSTTNLAADANGDNVVDTADYVIWRSNLGVTLTGGDSGSSPALHAVPEAATTYLLFVGAFAQLLRRSGHRLKSKQLSNQRFSLDSADIRAFK